MNGKRHALGRHQVQVHGHGDRRLQAEQETQSRHREPSERIFLAHRMRERAQHDESEERDENKAEHDTELFGGHREHEIRMAVRQDAFHRPLARPAAEPAAAHERLQRRVDLERVARARIEEALDARGDVRDELIGGEQREHRGGGGAGEPGPAHPRQEEERAPNQDQKRGLADVRLKDQGHRGRRKQAERRERRRHFRTPAAFRKSPGGEHDEGRFHEFRRLHAHPEDGEPAPRAFDLGTDEQRREAEHDADHEHRERDAAHLPRRHERGHQQHGQRRREIERVAVDEMKRIGAEPDRHRRARRQHQHQADEHQHHDRPEQEPVDGPPPFAEEAALRAREHGTAGFGKTGPSLEPLGLTSA